jgi:hypothetical protein
MFGRVGTDDRIEHRGWRGWRWFAISGDGEPQVHLLEPGGYIADLRERLGLPREVPPWQLWGIFEEGRASPALGPGPVPDEITARFDEFQLRAQQAYNATFGVQYEPWSAEEWAARQGWEAFDDATP